MTARAKAVSTQRGVRALALRLCALFALLFATTSTQELLSLAAGAGCCQGETCPDDEPQAGLDDAPACRACSHCGHTSGVLPAPAPSAARLSGPRLEPAARARELALSEHRTPPFRPPAG